MKKYNFTILFEKDEDGMYVATVPALHGCHTQAKSLKKIYPRIREAIELCLEGSHKFFAHSDGRTTVIPDHTGEDLGRGLI